MLTANDERVRKSEAARQWVFDVRELKSLFLEANGVPLLATGRGRLGIARACFRLHEHAIWQA